MNIQKIEKQISWDDGFIDVHSIFHTIQGEGPLCGVPAVFVRLAGCNLQCPHCDTDYTSRRKKMYIYEILESIKYLHKSSCLVVITGGEPFRQNIGLLIVRLWEEGYYIQIETNGTLPPPSLGGTVGYNETIDLVLGPMIVCSPKTGKIDSEILNMACAFKYVLSADSVSEVDGLPLQALGHSANPYPARPRIMNSYFNRFIYVQPMDAQDPEQNKRNMLAAALSCMKYGYTLQLQIHKILGVE